MLEAGFVNVLNNYTAARYNVPPPTVKITSDLDNVGKYYRASRTITLHPQANLHVFWHEFGHYLKDYKGNINNEFEANQFAAAEAKNLGVKLEPYKNYRLFIRTSQPEQLYTLVKMRESDLGLAVKNYSIKGDVLDLRFTPFYPQIFSNPSYAYGEMNLTPVVWGIMALAGTAGIGLALIWSGNIFYALTGAVIIKAAAVGFGVLMLYLVIRHLTK